MVACKNLVRQRLVVKRQEKSSLVFKIVEKNKDNYCTKVFGREWNKCKIPGRRRQWKKCISDTISDNGLIPRVLKML